jgi:hypothetical protein
MTISQREMIRRALAESERAAFDAALEADGLEDEIALLRVWVRRFLEDAETNPKLISAGVNALVRAVAAQYRMSPKASKALASNMAALLNDIGDLLALPES